MAEKIAVHSLKSESNSSRSKNNLAKKSYEPAFRSPFNAIAYFHRTLGNRAILRLLENDKFFLERQTRPKIQTSPAGSNEEETRALSDALCIGITPGQGPIRCRFTDQQLRRVRATKDWAWSLAARAALALGSGDRYIVGLAQRIFHISRPDIPAMLRTLDQIRDALWSAPVFCGTCADTTCNTGRRAYPAYVPDDFSGIVICPFFFAISLSQMARTFLHEAGHLVHIDDRPDYEHPAYCTEADVLDCDDPCAGIDDLLHNVDAWARFIECAAYSY